MEIPFFNEHGLLPPGDYQVTFPALRNSFLVTGEGCGQPWDAAWRLVLVNNLELLVKELWTVGIERIFIDGSFTEQVAHPHDIDGYFECELRYFCSGKLQKDLNFQNPHKIWTWSIASLRGAPNSAKRQLPMRFFYHVELYPHYGQTALTDKYGNQLQYPAAFRKRRSDDKPKGILLMQRETQDDQD